MPKQAYPLPVREVKLDSARPGPFDAGQAKGGAEEAVRRGHSLLFRHTEDHEERVDEERQPSTWAQEPPRLGDPGVRISPQARPVFRDREVEAGIRIRHRFGVAVQEAEVKSVLLLQPAGRG